MDLTPRVNLEGRDIRAEFVDCDPRLGEVYDDIMALGNPNEADPAELRRHYGRITQIANRKNLSAAELIVTMAAAAIQPYTNLQGS